MLQQLGAKAAQNLGVTQSFLPIFTRDDADNPELLKIISEQYVLLITNKGYTFDSCEIVGEQLVQKITVSGVKDDFRMTYRLTFEEERLGVVAAAVTQVSEDLAT